MKNLLLFPWSVYQKIFSPLLHEIGSQFILNPGCRFYPTCSQYSKESFNKYGVIKGATQSAKRVMGCNVFRKGGYDPVK